MSILLSVSKIKKTMGSKLLFEDLSFGVNERERLGLLGPNGAGKSTLLKIISGAESTDEGKVSYRKGLNFAFVAQEDTFEAGKTAIQVATDFLIKFGFTDVEAQVQASVYLSMAGFEDFDQPVEELSGGWRKRLSLSMAFSKEPELLILDEPTNHMDWDGILWLEGFLKSFKNTFILVSHDREFLDSLCNKTMEINRLYRDGYLAFECGYKQFVQRKQEYIEAQANLQDTLSNKARREVDWLRAGVKARTTKSQSRIKEAHELLDNLADVKMRNSVAKSKVRLEIDAAGKRSKKFLELTDVSIQYTEEPLIKNLNLLLGPKTCIGILGENGSGKTSLLKVICGAMENYSGDLFVAEDLKIVYFDQKRKQLPQDVDLVEYLGDGSDYTIFKDQSIHVASYASRFLFTSDRMKLKISQLSGGEQARLLIAKLLLQPADVLILDEPTNDLDIDSIEILEETISNFPGLVMLVSHDRFFLSRLCQKYLSLTGQGDWQMYADLNQWLRDKKSGEKQADKSAKASGESAPKSKVKLSYKDKRRMETIEKDIEVAEADLESAQALVSEAGSDYQKMQAAIKAVEEKQSVVDELYVFWDRVEGQLNS